MAPKQNQKYTMREITSRRKSPAVKAVYDRILVQAYEEQRKTLEKAKKIQK